eukprot:SAG11_NODE_18586_length_486_cov_4.390181_1_plen_84_part_10
MSRKYNRRVNSAKKSKQAYQQRAAARNHHLHTGKEEAELAAAAAGEASPKTRRSPSRRNTHKEARFEIPMGVAEYAEERTGAKK